MNTAEKKIRQHIIDTGELPGSITVPRAEFADMYCKGQLYSSPEFLGGHRYFEYMGVIVNPEAEAVSPLPNGWTAERDGNDFVITLQISDALTSSSQIVDGASLEHSLLHAMLDRLLP